MEGEGLSLRELKHSLRLALKRSGVVDEVKATLRTDFVKTLSSSRVRRELTYREILLLSALFHHLKRRSLLQSLSVFQAESGLESNVIMSEVGVSDALYLDNINLANSTCIDFIFDQICSRNRKAFMSTSSQTEAPASNIREALHNQMQEIRQTYLSKKGQEELSPSHTVEERMLVFERECELRLRREYDAQVAQMREVELSKVRMEEAGRARTELDMLRRELERDYQRRLQAHTEREELSARNALERERSQQQSQYEYRQRAQKEVDELRAREQNSARKLEMEAQGLALLELRIKESVSLLESRERELFRREREVDLQAKESQERARVEARTHLQEELDAVLRERSLVRMERQRVEEAKAMHQAVVDELAECRRELREARGGLAAKDACVEEERTFAGQREQERAAAIEALQREKDLTAAAERRLLALEQVVEEKGKALKEAKASSAAEKLAAQRHIDKLKAELASYARKESALSLRCEELDALLRDHQSVFANLLQNKQALKSGQAFGGKKHVAMQSAASSRHFSEEVGRAMEYRGRRSFVAPSSAGMFFPDVDTLYENRRVAADQSLARLAQPVASTLSSEYARLSALGVGVREMGSYPMPPGGTVRYDAPPDATRPAPQLVARDLFEHTSAAPLVERKVEINLATTQEITSEVQPQPTAPAESVDFVSERKENPSTEQKRLPEMIVAANEPATIENANADDGVLEAEMQQREAVARSVEKELAESQLQRAREQREEEQRIRELEEAESRRNAEKLFQRQLEEEREQEERKAAERLYQERLREEARLEATRVERLLQERIVEERLAAERVAAEKEMARAVAAEAERAAAEENLREEQRRRQEEEELQRRTIAEEKLSLEIQSAEQELKNQSQQNEDFALVEKRRQEEEAARKRSDDAIAVQLARAKVLARRKQRGDGTDVSSSSETFRRESAEPPILVEEVVDVKASSAATVDSDEENVWK